MKGFGRAGLSALATSTLVIGACVAGAGAAHADSTFQFTRVPGHDRYEVSANVAEKFGKADTVILASGEKDKYADSLSANYLAGVLNAPVLLTQYDQTPSEILKAIQDSGAKNVIIVGGTLSVSQAQQDALAKSYNVTRLDGNGGNRYDVNSQIIQQGNTKQDTAIIAAGYKFPDALAAGPLAFADKLPVGLVELNDAPTAVLNALKAQGVTKAIVLGGDLSISEDTRQQIENAGIKIVQEFKQGNRAGVSTALADYEIANYGFASNKVNVATGRDFAQGSDALSGASLTGQAKRPLLITAGDPKDGDQQATGQDILNWLQAHARTLTGTDNLMFGGPLSISDGQKALMEKAAQTVTSNQSYNVTPSQATTVNTATGHNTTDVTFSGISASKVDLRLINCSGESTDSSGTTTFKDSTPPTDKADMTAPSGASITKINGVSSTYGPGANSVNVSNGTVTATVTTTGAGCYQLVAFEDKNNDTFLNTDSNGAPTEPFAITGQITAVAIDGVAVDGGNNVVRPFGSYTATAQLTQGGKPVALAGIPVQFHVTNDKNGNVQEQTVLTDANGVASYQLSASDPNAASGDEFTYTVKATADANQDGTFGGSDPTGTQTVQFSDAAAAVSNVTIEGPTTRVALEGNPQTVTAKVTDQYGNPVSGVTVGFTATDTDGTPAPDLSGTGTTNANGEATFTYTRNTDATDTVEAGWTTPGASSGPTKSDTTEIDWSTGVATVNGVNYANLEDAIAAAQPGDTVTATGTFTEPTPGTGGGNTAAYTVSKDNVTVKGNNATITVVPSASTGAQPAAFYLGGTGDTLTGFTFNDTRTSGTGATDVLIGGDNATVSNNTLTRKTPSSVALIRVNQGASNATVTGNTLSGGAIGGDVTADPTSVTTITNNTVDKASNEGIWLITDSTSRITMTGNNVTNANQSNTANTSEAKLTARPAQVNGTNTFTETQAAQAILDGNPGINSVTVGGTTLPTP